MTGSRCSQVTLLITLLGLSPGALAAQAAALPPSELGEIRVLAVPMEAPRTPFGREISSFSLDIERVELQRGQTLKELLEARSIAPGGEVYGLIYALNPEVVDVDRLREGQTLYLPVIRAAAEFEAARAESAWRIEIGRQAEGQAVQSLTTMQRTLRAPERLPEEEFTRLVRDQGLERSLSILVDSLDADVLRHSSAGAATFALIHSYSALASRLFDRLVESDRAVRSRGDGNTRGATMQLNGAEIEVDRGLGGYRAERQATVDTLQGVAAELARAWECVRRNHQCDIRTEVSTITPQGDTVPNLILVAAPRFLVDDPTCHSDLNCTLHFYGPSSPAITHLTVGVDWVVRALAPGNEEEVGRRPAQPRAGVINRLALQVGSGGN